MGGRTFIDYPGGQPRQIDERCTPVRPSAVHLWLNARCGLIAILLWGNFCAAETLRVTTWNLGIPSSRPYAAIPIDQVAATLRILEPDVILLQGVQDWRQCTQVAGALKPADYRVLICSAFHGSLPLGADPAQVAILSKRPAYFTWSEAWQSKTAEALPQGVAFAAIQTDAQRLGFFTALFGDQPSGAELGRRLLDEVESVGRWETNQVQTFVIGASSGALVEHPDKVLRKASLVLDRAGFIDALEEMPSELKTTLPPKIAGFQTLADYLGAGPSGIPSNPRITVSPVSEHYPVTCDVDLDPDKVATAVELRAENRRERAARANLLTRKIVSWAGGLAFALAITIWILSKKRSRAVSLRPSRVPMQIPTESALAPLEPIIIAHPPASAPPPKPSARPHSPRLVLRLQDPSTPVPRPPNEQSVPAPADAEDSEPPSPPEAVAPQQQAMPDAPAGEDAEVRRGVIKELSGWLKQKLVRRLMSDRTQLMEAQHLATRMATSLDGRLARIEAQIQQQNQAYSRRIEDLNLELAAAREENRELIRERIAQVKAEMEAARARVIAEANLDNSTLRL